MLYEIISGHKFSHSQFHFRRNCVGEARGEWNKR